jgi:hypothetical protein
MKRCSASHAAQIVGKHAVVGEVRPALVVRSPCLENAAERGVIRRGSLGCGVGIVENSSYDFSGTQLWPGLIKVFARHALQDTEWIKSRQIGARTQKTKRLSHLQNRKSVRSPFLYAFKLVHLLQPVLEQMPRTTSVAAATTLARTGCHPVDGVEVQRIHSSSITGRSSVGILLTEAPRMRSVPVAQHCVMAVECRVHTQVVVLQVSQADALVRQASEHIEDAGHVVAESCMR